MSEVQGAKLGLNADRYPAPAKINRFLHVLGREGGYHRLQTVFQFLDWGDALTIRSRTDERIVLSGDLAGIPPEQNLVWKAATALQQKRLQGPLPGADIHIEKVIPPGSGLGGGSSDAATAMVVLNRLWGLGISEKELCDIGLGLGADVPVFIHGRACFAEGRGERMRDVSPDEGPLVLVLPEVFCSTAQVFSRPEMVRDSAAIRFEEWPQAVEQGRNDCLPAALASQPELAHIAHELGQHARFVMSGTGSSFYLRVPTREKMRTIAGLVSTVSGQVVTTSVTNLSPLHMQLGEDGPATR